ncbi:hypothetical protein N431DRAFT_554124 [Stipitochalara longipes BDJ]|nr:hypothetical protein N431DRAFT_554124 [Stipitochalara longipes BDJ]
MGRPQFFSLGEAALMSSLSQTGAQNSAPHQEMSMPPTQARIPLDILSSDSDSDSDSDSQSIPELISTWSSPEQGPILEPDEEEIPVEVLVQYLRNDQRRNRRNPRVRHQRNGISTLSLQTRTLRRHLQVSGHRWSENMLVSSRSMPAALPEPQAVAQNYSYNVTARQVLVSAQHFYPVGEIRASQDINNPQPQELIDRVALTSRPRVSAREDYADLGRLIIQHIEDIRGRHLERYFDLIRQYAVDILRSWCVHVYQVLLLGNIGTHNPVYRANPLRVLDPIAGIIDSRNAENIAAAVQRIRHYINGLSIHLSPFHQIHRQSEELAVVAELAKHLLEQGMEQERTVWEPLIRLHTGLGLHLVVQENNRLALESQAREVEPDYGEAGRLMDQIDEVDIYLGYRRPGQQRN